MAGDGSGEGAPRFIDPQALLRLKGVNLRARAVVDGVLQGMHKSPHQGVSIEFSEHKEYAPGDEIKHVDWKVFGRADKYYVKKFEQETSLQALMVVDGSASMSYGADGVLSKYAYAATLAATLGYLLLRQQDAVGLLRFDEAVGEVIPPQARLNHVLGMAETLERRGPRGGTRLDVALERVAEVLKRRGLIFVLSDFFLNDDGAFKVLRHLSGRGHEVVVLHVLDGDELSFPFKEMTLFEGLEASQRLLVEPALIRRDFLARMAAHQAAVREAALRAEAGYWLVDTRVAPGEVVLKFLRERRHGASGRR